MRTKIKTVERMAFAGKGTVSGEMALDILEAYELIKEMRSALEVVRDNTLNPAHTMTMLGLEETTDANHRLASAILEKTKDYAESYHAKKCAECTQKKAPYKLFGAD